MLHTKFPGNRPAGSGVEDFEVFTIYGRGGHLGHVTSIMSSDFHFFVPENFHKKFGLDRHSSCLNFCMYTTLGHGQVMTLTFNSLTFINSIRCLHLPTFRSLAAIVSEKSTVFTFSYRKACYQI